MVLSITPNWWFKRLFFTCNHGSIGLVYIIAGSIGGSIGTAFSFLMRAELSIPGYVLVKENLHDYNVWITAHGILMIFFMVMPLMGFDPTIIAVAGVISTLWGIVGHTQIIGKLGPLEWIFNTPSHHRVHHGANEQYIDKNYGNLLIIWDLIS